MAKTAQDALNRIITNLDPPKPQPEPVQEPIPVGGDPYEDTSHWGGAPAEPRPLEVALGQSVGNPTIHDALTEESGSSGNVAQTDNVQPQASPVDPDPEPLTKWTYEWYSWNDRRTDKLKQATLAQRSDIIF